MTTIYSWNVNGIRSVLRKDALRPFIQTEQPDILCLQETKAQPGQAEIDLPEYREYWHSATKPGYSGTAILSKTEALSLSPGLPADIQQAYDMTTDGYGDPNTEGRVLVAEYPAFYLVTVYTPNAKDDLSRVPLRHDHWDPAFLAYCRRLEETKPVVFCGDLNVAHTELDLAHPQANRGKKGFTDEERAGFEAFLAAGFVDTFRMFEPGGGHYTWWSNFTRARERNVGWRIDYFLVSGALRDRVKAAAVHPQYMGSDHCPISVTLDV
jgi:exodeoxyribonuclease-3